MCEGRNRIAGQEVNERYWHNQFQEMQRQFDMMRSQLIRSQAEVKRLKDQILREVPDNLTEEE